MSFRRDIIESRDYKRKSKLFLLPMLDYPLDEYEPYLIDCNVVLDPGKLVVIFDNLDDDPLSMLVYKLQSSYLYLDSNFDDDDKEVVMFFDIPKEFKEDFIRFTQGKYSEFSDKYKKKLISFFGKETSSVYAQFSMYDALYPTEEKRKERAGDLGYDQWEDIKELFSIPTLEYEEYKSIEDLKLIYGE